MPLLVLVVCRSVSLIAFGGVRGALAPMVDDLFSDSCDVVIRECRDS